MKKFWTKFSWIIKKRANTKVAVFGKAQNLVELRQYVEKLYATVREMETPIKAIMHAKGLTHLIDDEGALIPEAENYPELKQLYIQRLAIQQKMEFLLQSHPELWKPIEDDASIFYDARNIKRRIDDVYNQDVDYIQNLEKRCNELAGILGPIEQSYNKNLDTAPSPEVTDLMNEYFYSVELLRDALATVGDKQDKILWDAVPKVIKDKYTDFVNDKMVEILASDDNLAECVKNFDADQTDPDAHERFRWFLQRKLNAELFDKVGKPITINLYFDKNSFVDGFYRAKDNTANFNTAKWAKSDSKISSKYGIDNVVGIIKHEILGHYANYNLSDMGLYGTTMKDFIKGVQSWTHAHLFAATDIRVIMARSPLLHEYYPVSMPSDAAKKELHEQGWDLGFCVLQDDFNMYQSTFEERSAWAVTPVYDIVGQIDEYRAKHGLKPIEKTR